MVTAGAELKETEMPQQIRHRAIESRQAFVEYAKPPLGAPNVLMVVLDDVGFAQLGCFGAGIDTPNIDRLAQGGLRYNRFHVTAICSATRAALLTGRNHHAVGMGTVGAVGFPGYNARIPRSAASLARVLKDNGYSTMAVGKWHLAPPNEYSASGPMDRWPLGLGFERFYGFLGAETNQWAPELVRDNTHVEPPRTPEEGYHLSEDLADEAIRMIQDQQQATPDKPFFCYFATGAAHAPHHAPPEWLEHYRGRFDAGWEQWRDEAFARQRAVGIVPDGARMSERPPWVPEWDSLSTDEQRVYARFMEAFAAMMSHADAQIGRLIDSLDARGVLDDTLVVLLSDNGASGEGGRSGNFDEQKAVRHIGQSLEEKVARIDEIGGKTMYNHYPYGWAWAGNAPFHLWKRYTWLGGVRVPLIVRWPQRITDPGSVRPQFCHAVDLFPTVLDLVGIEAPVTVDGVTQQPVDGTSLADSLADGDVEEVHTLQYFEMHGSRSLYKDGWKVTTNHISPIFDEREYLIGSSDLREDHWALFNLDEDFAETHDLAESHPEIVEEMKELWWAEAGRNQVLPFYQGRSAAAVEHPGEYPKPARAVYTPGGGPIVGTQLPEMVGGFRLDAAIEIPPGTLAQGIVCAVGDLNAGWALYLLDGRPTAHLALLQGDDHVAAAEPLEPGAHELSMVCRTGGETGGTVTLAVDGAMVAEAPLTGSLFFMSLGLRGVGMRIGVDRGLAVSGDYSPPFEFTGLIRQVVMESLRPEARPNPAAVLRTALGTD
jgi:arylsulfatase